MKIWLKFPMILGIVGWAFTGVLAGPAPPSEAAASIQAIQQAPDPSAAIAAYANGVAVDRNDPKLYEAYVSRMVDLGLPEMAYHQAQSLSVLESDNGLAWGVIAYVNARKGDMPTAVSAINLAGQFAPSNVFVQRTAGEILAWYDIKADKTTLADNAKAGLAKIRTLLESQPAYTEAYNTAKNAYQAQASVNAPVTQYTPAPSGQPAYPPPVYAASPYPPPIYYPDEYYYDWGPTWVEPAPWWWWHPVGFFAGFDFFPFSTVVVFDHHHHFDHFDHHHDGFFHGHDQFHHDGRFFAHHGQPAFFGTAARPNPSFVTSTRNSFAIANTGRTFSPRGNSIVIHNNNMMFHNNTVAPAFRTMPNNTFAPAFRTMPNAPVMRPNMPAIRTSPQRFAAGPHSSQPMPAFQGGMSGGFHGTGGFHGGGMHGGGGHR